MAVSDDCRFEYIVNHEAWYYLPKTDTARAGGSTGRELNIRSAATGGGVAWEFMIQEYSFGNHPDAVRVCIFDDAFAAFTEIPEFFTALRDEHPTTLAAVRSILDRVGAVDATARETPHGVQPARMALVDAINRAEEALASYDAVRSQ